MAARPNFFIVGAPKCGTTALFEYLRPHPRIFMSPVKEPHYFATDMGAYPAIKTLAAYTALFAESTPEHLAVGEASVYYLRSSTAVLNIHDFNPEARIIAMFRNPVDMVYSLHAQLLYVAEETEADFETAWRLQAQRSRGFEVPSTCREPLLLQYGQVGQFGSQAKRVLSIFPPTQVKLILYDDFAANPGSVYAEVIEFLRIPHDGRTTFPRINESKRARLDWLRMFSRRPPPVLHAAVRGLKRAVGEERISAIKKRIVALNTVRERRPPLNPKLRAELVAHFSEEVALLSRIMQRDLSHWT